MGDFVSKAKRTAKTKPARTAREASAMLRRAEAQRQREIKASAKRIAEARRIVREVEQAQRQRNAARRTPARGAGASGKAKALRGAGRPTARPTTAKRAGKGTLVRIAETRRERDARLQDQIEQLLGEDFNSLAEAKTELKKARKKPARKGMQPKPGKRKRPQKPRAKLPEVPIGEEFEPEGMEPDPYDVLDEEEEGS